MNNKKETTNNILFCNNIKLSKDKRIRTAQMHGGGLPYILRNNGVDTRDFALDTPKIEREMDDTYQTDLEQFARHNRMGCH